ncbi:hypothetical protein [Streptomyces caniscabiei]|uniref:Regulatory protein n=1 Tax=Streptomyces caniscabiei TaxID=2746961 RepID=A0ABU4MSG1_9ACTN|nr:hypothetical protein [Streptomyces caniscabiei]MBE4737375.1 hypothetical protein [Streptomyces caniscabiei]MBE4756135.1 hypothetical protein [Streptomyces caniscabiei]MBE4769848.1 hypothetical protein [Streptomyces caniscabiei]MBE4787206.1 hypothetical protein [Streptomyces caniscabiei]MBE4795389.1 hypothetical protein [Streptomyces caniscabiei]
MTETPSESTDLKTQYTAQVATDLERNAKEQERLIGEIDALQEQLLSLRQDHAVLVNMQQALGVAAPEPTPAAEEVTTPSVPRQKTAPAPEAGKRTRARKAEPSQGGKGTRKATATQTAGPRTATTKTTTAKTTSPKTESPKAESPKPTAAKTTTATKTVTTKASTAKSGTAKASDDKASTAKPAAGKTAASKPPATKTAASKTAAKTATATATAEKAQPTLVELIRRHLTEQSEPRSAAEVATALTQAHPDRRIQTNVVRTTLEGLVAKSNAQRVKQGSSVYYTGPDAPEQATPPQPASEPAPAAD